FQYTTAYLEHRKGYLCVHKVLEVIPRDYFQFDENLLLD
ncbi:MAG: hypothetical protein RLZZ382_1451, partial [Bacteroidota bacterium]